MASTDFPINSSPVPPPSLRKGPTNLSGMLENRSRHWGCGIVEMGTGFGDSGASFQPSSACFYVTVGNFSKLFSPGFLVCELGRIIHQFQRVSAEVEWGIWHRVREQSLVADPEKTLVGCLEEDMAWLVVSLWCLSLEGGGQPVLESCVGLLLWDAVHFSCLWGACLSLNVVCFLFLINPSSFLLKLIQPLFSFQYC